MPDLIWFHSFRKYIMEIKKCHWRARVTRPSTWRAHLCFGGSVHSKAYTFDTFIKCTKLNCNVKFDTIRPIQVHRMIEWTLDTISAKFLVSNGMKRVKFGAVYNKYTQVDFGIVFYFVHHWVWSKNDLFPFLRQFYFYTRTAFGCGSPPIFDNVTTSDPIQRDSNLSKNLNGNIQCWCTYLLMLNFLSSIALSRKCLSRKYVKWFCMGKQILLIKLPILAVSANFNKTTPFKNRNEWKEQKINE